MRIVDNNVFEIVKLILQICLIILTAFIVPTVKRFLSEKTTKEQRENAKFWTMLAVKYAEEIYKEKGQGKLKKEYVVDWLNKNNIKISNEQMDTLIEMVVTEFNKNGWDTPIVLE